MLKNFYFYHQVESTYLCNLTSAGLDIVEICSNLIWLNRNHKL